MNNGAKKILTIIIAASIVLPYIALPMEAEAQAEQFSECAISSTMAAIGKVVGTGKQAASATAATKARTAWTKFAVPVSDPGALGTETTAPPANLAENTGSFYGKLYDNFKDTCLKNLAVGIAKIIIRQMRGMVINWINTGNIGGTATFVTNFEFDAKQTASNAARLFASKATGIDFCNYFPYNPAVNLDFRADLRIALECNVDKTFEQHVAEVIRPSTRTPIDDVLSMYPDRDPLKTEFLLQQAMASEVASAQKARETQVTSGRGFIGVERCKRTQIVEAGKYIYTSNPSATWTPPASDGEYVIPEGVQAVPPRTICTEKQTVTPGVVSADLVKAAIDSNFREGDLVDEFGEAIGAIVDAMVGKLINDGLTKAGL